MTTDLQIEKRPITVWARYDSKRDVFEHNHIEEGHVASTQMVPTDTLNRGWKNGKWEKRLGYLDPTPGDHGAPMVVFE